LVIETAVHLQTAPILENFDDEVPIGANIEETLFENVQIALERSANGAEDTLRESRGPITHGFHGRRTMRVAQAHIPPHEYTPTLGWKSVVTAAYRVTFWIR
jgi:hypothetical protein